MGDLGALGRARGGRVEGAAGMGRMGEWEGREGARPSPEGEPTREPRQGGRFWAGEAPG